MSAHNKKGAMVKKCHFCNHREHFPFDEVSFCCSAMKTRACALNKMRAMVEKGSLNKKRAMVEKGALNKKRAMVKKRYICGDYDLGRGRPKGIWF